MGVGAAIDVVSGDTSQAHHTVPQLLRGGQGSREMDTKVSLSDIVKL